MFNISTTILSHNFRHINLTEYNFSDLNFSVQKESEIDSSYNLILIFIQSFFFHFNTTLKKNDYAMKFQRNCNIMKKC